MRKFLIIVISLCLFNCSNSKINSFNSELEQIEKNYAPDKSIAVFDVELKKTGGNWIMRGETTSKNAKRSVFKSAKSILGNADFQDSLAVLPYFDLGADTIAVVNVSVANLRRNPSVTAELVDQAILGDKLRLLKKHNNRWYFVQTEYGYLGWVTRYSIKTKSTDSEWFAKPMARVTALNSYIYSEPNEDSEIISDVVINSKINILDSGTPWSKVQLPDGRYGFLKKSDYKNVNDIPREISVDEFIATAKSMMGVPYLWGGSSSKMNDCSGFTSTVFLANGMQLPRDARQQALIGENVEYDGTFDNVLPGDLLFFGSSKRITHVGMSLGGKEFIHQDGHVMINSFDEKSDQYDEHRWEGLQLIKRVF